MALSRRKKAEYYAQYLLARGILGLLRLLPFRLRIKAGGALLGGLIARLGKFRKRIGDNLRYIYPDMDEARIAQLIHAVSHNFGRTFTEYLFNADYGRQQDLFHVTGAGFDALRAAQEQGKGAILITGHYGQWEAGRHYCKAQGIEVGAIYRPNNNPYFERLHERALKQAGGPLFPVGRKGTMEMVRHLKNGGVVIILVDQNTEAGEVFDFLGKPALTSKVAAKVALKQGVPLIPFYGTRRAGSLDIDVDFELPLTGTDADSLTQAINDSLAARVQAHPEQWYWLHRRWGKLD